MSDELGDLLPRPDPTVLTTAQLFREIAAMQNLLMAEIRTVDIASRDRDEATTKLKEEKFLRIWEQLDQNEAARVERKEDDRRALSAAFDAAKELVREQRVASDKAIDKSEAATTKQIDQMTATFQARFDESRREADEMKDRLGKNEQAITGLVSAQAGGNAVSARVYVAIGLTISLLGVIVGIAIAFLH